MTSVSMGPANISVSSNLQSVSVPLTVYNLVKEELKQIRKDASVKLAEKKQYNSKSKKKKKKISTRQDLLLEMINQPN